MQRDLSVSDPFAARHIGPSSDDQRAMLATLGYETLDDLIKAALPAEIPDGSQAAPSLAKLPAARTETQVLADLRRLAARNTVRVSMIGLGYYATNTPAVIRRNVLENPAWYTAYTPYQPEISQGRLEALLNFQTMICDLTALPVANASLLDEASAAAEAMTLARRVAPRGAGADLPGRRGLPPADPRRAAHPGRAPGHRAAGCPGHGRDRLRRRLRRAAAVPGRVRRGPRPRPGDRGRARRQGHRRGRGRRARADDAQAPGRARRGHRDRHHPAVRRPDDATAARTPPTWPSARTSSGSCPAAWSASRSTPTAARRCGSPCRPASSTSAARRPPATSAPPRCCWRSPPPCTRSTTARTA